MSFSVLARFFIIALIVLPFAHLSRCELLSGFTFPSPLPWECLVGRDSPPDLFTFRDNPLTVPAVIMPEWYFAPFFQILKSGPNELFGIDAKTLGVVLMAAAFLPPFLFAFLKWSRISFRGVLGIAFVPASLVALGILGYFPFEGLVAILSRLLTVFYFLGSISLFALLRVRQSKNADAISETF